MITHYKTIEQSEEVEESIKNSKFISVAFPIETVEEFEARIAALKEEHPKAGHFCYGYRLGLDKNNFRANDDGEPSGSAGLPILNQIDSFEITNVLVVVVRYFGGTKLGVSGLISAYKGGAKLVLEKTKIIEKEVQEIYTIECSYLEINDLLNFLKQLGIESWEQDYAEKCKISFKIGISRTDSLHLWLERMNLSYKSEKCY